MRITASQYGKTLYELTKNKSEKEIDNIIVNFLKILIKNRHLKIAKKVMAKFAEISNQEQGIVEAEVISREKLSDQLRNKVSKYVSNKYSAKEVIIKNKIDLNIKGGIIIKIGDEVLDGSIATQLNKLKQKLVS